MHRRSLLGGLGAALVGCGRTKELLPDAVAKEGLRPAGLAPEPRWGTQTGDVTSTRAVIWSRTDRRSRLVVECASSERFHDARRFVGPLANESTDLTAKLAVVKLPLLHGERRRRTIRGT